MITLHPTLGVNPHLTYCEQCGKDLGIALLGANDGVYACAGAGCNVKHLGTGTPKCPKCGERNPTRNGRIRTIAEYEKIPGGICDDCQKLNQQTAVLVAQGGVYFECKRCGSAGAIKPENPLCQEVREALNVPTGPCGVEFDTCPVCEEVKS